MEMFILGLYLKLKLTAKTKRRSWKKKLKKVNKLKEKSKIRKSKSRSRSLCRIGSVQKELGPEVESEVIGSFQHQNLALAPALAPQACKL